MPEEARKVKKSSGKETFNSVKFTKKYGINVLCEKRTQKPAYLVPFGNSGQFVDVVLTRRTVPKECPKLALTFCMPWSSGEVPPTQNVIKYLRKIARTFKKVEDNCLSNDYNYNVRRATGQHEQNLIQGYRRVFNIQTRESVRDRNNVSSTENKKILALVKQGEKIRTFFGKCFGDLIVG